MKYNLLYPMGIMNEKDFKEYVLRKAQSILPLNNPKTEALKEGIFFPEPPDAIKQLLNKSSICSIHQSPDKDCSICNHAMNEEVTPSAVKDLVDQMKKINLSLSFENSLINGSLNESEEKSSDSSNKRYLKVAGYENKNIELGETLKETMFIYNKQKDISRGTETDEASWKRLVKYGKYKDQ